MAAGTPNNDDPGASAGQGEQEERETTTLGRLLARLQELRTARGLTQESFAEASGFSYKYYQAVEAGRKRDLRLSTLERLARATAWKCGNCSHRPSWSVYVGPQENLADNARSLLWL